MHFSMAFGTEGYRFDSCRVHCITPFMHLVWEHHQKSSAEENPTLGPCGQFWVSRGKSFSPPINFA